MVMNPMSSVLLLAFVISVSNAQDPNISIAPSSAPSVGATIIRPSQITTTTDAPSNAPLFTSSPTLSQCISNPRWHYEYWEPVGCSHIIRLSLTCDHDLVRCGFYGNLGYASKHCCKCKPDCHGQCNEPIQLPPLNGDWSDDCHGDGYEVYDDYEGEGPGAMVIVVACLVLVCCAVSLCHYNSQAQRTARSNRQSTRQTMTTRRQQQRENNATSTSPRLTEEERNHARYELFVTNFLFQTVLPDKSNVTANSLRSSACKPTADEEHPREAKDDDDASSAGRLSIGVGPGYLSERLSSWRRPSAKDECCICLECYTIGETICAPITTECDHVFHEGCINEWLKKNDKCPLCRVELLKD